MAREKSPGLKILWIWTIGTAAILVTNVVHTRLRDMDLMMKQEKQPNQNQSQSSSSSDTLLTDETMLSESDSGIAQELK